MAKGLVCIGHAVHVLFLFKGRAFFLISCHDLAGEFFLHGFFVAIAGKLDQVFHADGLFTSGPDLGWNLKGGTPDTAAPYLNGRCNIGQCFLPYFQSVFLCTLRYDLDSIVKDLESGILLAP